MLHVDDPGRIEGYRRFLEREQPLDPATLDVADRRLLRMLVASLVDQGATRDTDLVAGARIVLEHPQVRAELLELLDVLSTRITHVTMPLTRPVGVPLRVHASYSRLEILAALGVHADRAAAPSWQAGVQWVAEARSDVFAFTL